MATTPDTLTHVVTEEATWDCACTSEHWPTIGRAWCFDCSEWCYPKALCIRGEHDRYTKVLVSIADGAEDNDHARHCREHRRAAKDVLYG